MVSIQNELGKKGEAIARDLLIAKGFGIIESNWRWGRAEIDIIADLNGLLVFVEVKTRSSTTFGQPEQFINQQKIDRIAKAASAYMRACHHEWAFRFDVISIVFKSSEDFEVQHLEDAFFPGLM